MNRLRRLLVSPVLALVGASLLAAPGARGATPAAETVIESEQLDMKSTDTESEFIFSNHVVVTGNNLTLTSDRLEVTTLRGGDLSATVSKLGRFKRLVALGHVKIVQGDREAVCGRAELMPGEDKIVLTENPIVTDYSNKGSVTGARIVLFRGERRAVVESGGGGPTHVTLPAIKDLGFADAKTATPPAPKPPSTPAP
jgi:lipopolysaccharide export system protein LptA